MAFLFPHCRMFEEYGFCHEGYYFPGGGGGGIKPPNIAWRNVNNSCFAVLAYYQQLRRLIVTYISLSAKPRDASKRFPVGMENRVRPPANSGRKGGQPHLLRNRFLASIKIGTCATQSERLYARHPQGDTRRCCWLRGKQRIRLCPP